MLKARGWRDEAEWGSGSIHEAIDLDLGEAEVDQQTDFHAGRLEIVDALGVMHIVESLGSLQFNNYPSVDDQISHVLTNDNTIVDDLHPFLLLDGESRLPKFVCQCVLVHLLQKPTPNVLLTTNAHRIISPVNSFNSPPQSSSDTA